MELATVKSPYQLLFCWYVFKSIRNMENENQLSLLDLGVSCLMDVNGNENANHFDTYQNYEIECEQREKLMAFLYEKNIGTIIQWGGKAIHQIEALNFNSELPYTNEIFKKCLLLPMNTTLTDEAVEYIISVIQEFYIQS